MYWRRPVFFMYARISSVDDGILLYFVDFARSLSGGKMKVLVLLSGGVDSSTCLALAKEKYGDNVLALSMSYGQKHAKELAAAQAIADYYHVELLHMDLSKIFAHSKCSLLQGSEESVPHASYAEQLKESKGEPVSTYVPFRNGLFLSAAASIALEYECN